MRLCADCQGPDVPYYDVSQPCECPCGPGVHVLAKHLPHCARVRHSVVPYRKRLRMWRKDPDGREQTADGKYVLADAYAYLRRNGFVGVQHSGFLWSEKYLCRPCIETWELRQALKRDYDALSKARQQSSEPGNEYEAALYY